MQNADLFFSKLVAFNSRYLGFQDPPLRALLSGFFEQKEVKTTVVSKASTDNGGTLMFGVIVIPISLFSGANSIQSQFKLLAKSGEVLLEELVIFNYIDTQEYRGKMFRVFDSDNSAIIPKLARLHPALDLRISYSVMGEKQYVFGVDAFTLEETGSQLLAPFENERVFLFHTIGLSRAEQESRRQLFPLPKDTLEAFSTAFTVMPTFLRNSLCFAKVFRLQFFVFETIKKVHFKAFFENRVASWFQNKEFLSQFAEADKELSECVAEFFRAADTRVQNPNHALLCVILSESPVHLKGVLWAEHIKTSFLLQASGAMVFADKFEFMQKFFVVLSPTDPSAIFAVLSFIGKVAPFWSLAKADKRLTDFLFLLAPTATGTTKDFASDKFLVIQMVKLMVNTKHPDFYAHLLAVGSSVELLFLEDVWFDFAESFGPELWLSFKELFIFIKSQFKDYRGIMVFVVALVLDLFIEEQKEVLLATSDSVSLSFLKRDLMAKYHNSMACSQSGVCEKVVRRLSAAFTSQSEDIFESFDVFHKIFEETSQQVAQDYTSVFFDNFKVSEVEQLFKLTRNVPDSADLFKKVEADWGDFEPPADDPEQEWVPGPCTVYEAEAFSGVELCLYPLESLLFNSDTQLKDFLLELVAGKTRLKSVYSPQAKKYSLQSVIIPQSAAQEIDFALSTSTGQFLGRLSLENAMNNIGACRTVLLWNATQGFIYLPVTFVVKKFGPANLEEFRVEDITVNYCLDRNASLNVYRTPSIIDTRSVVHKKYIELKLSSLVEEVPIAKYALECVAQYLKPDTQTFPLAKLLLYLCVNSKRSESGSLKAALSLAFKILAFFERRDQLCFETVLYFIEAMWTNLLPFTPFHIIKAYTEFLFCGGAGRVESAMLLNSWGEAVADVTEILRTVVLQNQIHSGLKFANFGDRKFIQLIADRADSLGQQVDESMTIRVSFVLNSCRTIQQFSVKPPRSQIHSFLNLESATLVDEETFVKVLQNERLVRGFFLVGQSADERVPDGIVEIEGVSLPAEVVSVRAAGPAVGKRETGLVITKPKGNDLDRLITDKSKFTH